MSEGSSEVLQVARRVGDKEELCERQLPLAQNPERRDEGLSRVALFHYRRCEGVESRLAVGPAVAHRWHHEREEWRQQLLQVVADEKVFLAWLGNDGRRKDRVASVPQSVNVKDRKVVCE